MDLQNDATSYDDPVLCGSCSCPSTRRISFQSSMPTLPGPFVHGATKAKAAPPKITIHV